MFVMVDAKLFSYCFAIKKLDLKVVDSSMVVIGVLGISCYYS